MKFSVDQTPILVTGGTGHTGRRLVQRLLDLGARVRCMVHTPANRSRLPEHANIEVVYGSASDPKDLAEALAGANTVLHLAHIRYAPMLVKTLEERLGSGEATGPVRLVAMSSTRLLSRFASPTREAVRVGENAIMSSSASIQWTIIRSSMIFGGPDDNNLERMAAHLRKNRIVPVFGSGKNLVQPNYVWDLVAALVACVERPAAIGRCYVVAGPEAMTWRAMVEEVARACGARPPIFVRLPYRVSLAAAMIVKTLWPGFPLGAEFVERFGEDRAFDIAEAQRDLGVTPIAFREALGKKFRGKV